jgi:hypothetical protein
MSSRENMAVKLHDFVYDKIVSIDVSDFLKRCTSTDIINIINIYYIQKADPIMNLCLPACYEIFLISNSPKLCEYIVYNVPLENDQAIINFVEKNEHNKNYQWKVELALNWIEMYRQDYEDIYEDIKRLENLIGQKSNEVESRCPQPNKNSTDDNKMENSNIDENESL